MNDSRLDRLEQRVRELRGGRWRVVYKDGSMREIQPTDAINLILSEGGSIEKFEELDDSQDNGKLLLLTNAILET